PSVGAMYATSVFRGVSEVHHNHASAATAHPGARGSPSPGGRGGKPHPDVAPALHLSLRERSRAARVRENARCAQIAAIAAAAPHPSLRPQGEGAGTHTLTSLRLFTSPFGRGRAKRG